MYFTVNSTWVVTFKQNCRRASILFPIPRHTCICLVSIRLNIMENKHIHKLSTYIVQQYIHKSVRVHLTMMLKTKTLGFFLFLRLLVPLHSKLILSTNRFKPVQNERSNAEILNSSLQRFDSFTLCARYCQQNSTDVNT